MTKIRKTPKKHWSEEVDSQIVVFIKINHKGIHPSRIEVVSPTKVIVHNQRKR